MFLVVFKQNHFYVSECNDGWYGENCKEQCGQCLNVSECDPVTGHCKACEPGYNYTADGKCQTRKCTIEQRNYLVVCLRSKEHRVEVACSLVLHKISLIC